MIDSKGKKSGFLAIVRCSTRAQADSSTDDQLKVIRGCKALEGISEVDVIWLEGVSASTTPVKKLVSVAIRSESTPILTICSRACFGRKGGVTTVDWWNGSRGDP